MSARWILTVQAADSVDLQMDQGVLNAPTPDATLLMVQGDLDTVAGDLLGSLVQAAMSAGSGQDTAITSENATAEPGLYRLWSTTDEGVKLSFGRDAIGKPLHEILTLAVQHTQGASRQLLIQSATAQ